jgi:hypothetical protein
MLSLPVIISRKGNVELSVSEWRLCFSRKGVEESFPRVAVLLRHKVLIFPKTSRP